MQFENYYGSMGSFVFANGTDGAVDGGVTSFAYPTPYLGINDFILYTSVSENAASGQCLVFSARQGVEISSIWLPLSVKALLTCCLQA